MYMYSNHKTLNQHDRLNSSQCQLVVEHHSKIEASMSDYQMLEEYFYVLTDEDFEVK